VSHDRPIGALDSSFCSIADVGRGSRIRRCSIMRLSAGSLTRAPVMRFSWPVKKSSASSKNPMHGPRGNVAWSAVLAWHARDRVQECLQAHSIVGVGIGQEVGQNIGLDERPIWLPARQKGKQQGCQERGKLMGRFSASASAGPRRCCMMGAVGFAVDVEDDRAFDDAIQERRCHERVREIGLPRREVDVCRQGRGTLRAARIDELEEQIGSLGRLLTLDVAKAEFVDQQNIERA
jgi:hypothetical protein